MTNSQAQALLPAYLVVGEDELKRRRVIERLRARVAQTGDLEFNREEFNGERASGDAIVQACNMLPFASDLRLVEVVSADKLNKAGSEALVEYLKAPNETTVLALSAVKLAKNTRLYKAVAALGKSSVIDCAPMKRHELYRALRSMAVGRGFTMTQGAAERLVALIGEDTVALDSELSKLALACAGSSTVTERDISQLVSRTAEAKPWELVDAFSARDIAGCVRILPLLDSSSPYALIGMCTIRLRELVCARALSVRGEQSRLTEVLKLPPWRVKNHHAWASRYSDAELAHAFSTARDCERAMKSGADPQAAFEEWLFSTMA